MVFKSLRSIKDIKKKRVLFRADFNVPVKNGKIKDDYKIVKQLDTLRYLLDRECKIVILTHLGRPKAGKHSEKFSLDPIAKRLSHLLGKKVRYIKDLVGFEASTAVAKMNPSEIVLLDNIRFEEGEIKNSKKFAKKLAVYGDIYVNDAFAVSHRASASLSAIKKFLPSYAGFLMEEEVTNLSRALKPKRPFVAIVGGAKLKTKIPLIKKLDRVADHILVGGALANNFLVAHNFEVGKSLIDHEGVYFVRKNPLKKVVTPVDVIVSSKKDGGIAQVKNLKDINKNDYIFDIGPKTIKLYINYIKEANMFFWNGPLGFFELKDFKHGTLTIARMIAARSKGKAFGIVGGGETVEALKMTKMIHYVDWVSTGGGAMFSFLSKEKMPGLKGLIKK